MNSEPVDESLFHEFDGKSVEPFEAAAALWSPDASSMNELVALAAGSDVRVQVGATWVLKRWIETGVGDPQPIAAVIVDLIPEEMAPDATLHLLQMLQHLELPTDRENALFRACSTLTEHPKKFVRAWAYDGLGRVAIQNRKFRARVTKLFDDAEENQPASVLARIRNLRKWL